MRSKRWFFVSVVAALAAMFLLVFAQQEGSVRIGTKLAKPNVWAGALEALFELNFELDSAIFDYENDVIEEEELEQRITMIEQMKADAIQLFPDVEGVSFYGLYTWLKTLNDDLDEARDAIDDFTATESDVVGHLKDAKSAKEEAEDLIEQQT